MAHSDDKPDRERLSRVSLRTASHANARNGVTKIPEEVPSPVPAVVPMHSGHGLITTASGPVALTEDDSESWDLFAKLVDASLVTTPQLPIEQCVEDLFCARHLEFILDVRVSPLH